jgi:hypothetical protein
MAPATVTIPVLAICMLLTALVTTALFTCIVCLHLRRTNRGLEYREEQRGYYPQSPAVDMPHVIDLPGSYAGGAPPRTLSPAPPSFAPLQHGPSTELLLLPPGSPGLGGLKGEARPGSGLVLFPPDRAAGGAGRGRADAGSY